jgi:hypothetical protein
MLSKTVNSDLCQQYPPSIQYQRTFVKKLLTTVCLTSKSPVALFVTIHLTFSKFCQSFYLMIGLCIKHYLSSILRLYTIRGFCALPFAEAMRTYLKPASAAPGI